MAIQDVLMLALKYERMGLTGEEHAQAVLKEMKEKGITLDSWKTKFVKKNGQIIPQATEEYKKVKNRGRKLDDLLGNEGN